MKRAADQDDEERILDLGDLNSILALNYVIKKLDYGSFERFLLADGMDSDSSLFDGFLFLAKTVSSGLLEEISRSWSLNFPDDFAFSRACNRGVPLSKIKNSSLKVVFVKNLHKCLREWWASKDKLELQERREIVCRSIAKPLDKILERDLCLRREFEKYSKEEIVRRLAIDYALIALSDTDRGYPQGHFFSLSRSSLSEQYLSKVFKGYKLGLVFLWKQLLMRSTSEKSESQLLHQLARSEDWHKLVSFFRPIQEKIVDPLEKELPINLGFGKYFQIKTPINPKSFGKNLYETPSEPSLSKEEDLQQTLFWYPVQAMKGSYVFNGVAAFVAVLAGTITLKRLFGIKEKSYVVRFVHSVAEGKNNYSYAVLIGAYGTIGDYSGWLVFYDCAGDYSGFAGSEHRQAEMIIDRYKETNEIDLIEYKIDSKALLDYLTVFSAELTELYDPFVSKIPVDGNVKKHKKILREISLSSKVRKLDMELGSAKGLVLELLSYYFFVSKGYTATWRYKNSRVIGEDEIDVVMKDGSSNLHLVSCMASFDLTKAKKLDDQARRIFAARRSLKPDFGAFKQVQKAIFLPKDVDSKERKSIEDLDLQVFSIERILKEDTSFSKAQKPQLETLFRISQEMRHTPQWFARWFSINKS